MVGPVLSIDTSVDIEAIPGAAFVQRGHKGHVGGPAECEGRQVGHSIAQASHRSGLGERVHGHAGRTVSRRHRDLWCGAVHTISGKVFFGFLDIGRLGLSVSN